MSQSSDTLSVMRPIGSPEVLEARRRIAARLLAQGKSLTEVAASVGSSVSSVKRWRDALASHGMAALDAKPHPGPRPRLTPQERDDLAVALECGAMFWGFSTDEWNCPRVQKVIRDLFGVLLPRGLRRYFVARNELDGPQDGVKGPRA